MAAKHFQSKNFNVPAEHLIGILKDRSFCSKLNLELKSENPTSTGVWFRFHHGTTFSSWGEKITVTLTPLPSNITKVDVKSECGMPTQVVDWGKNRQNVCNILEYIEKQLSSCGTAATTVVQAAAPTQTAASRNLKYCFKCGKQITADSNFCCFCGTKQN